MDDSFILMTKEQLLDRLEKAKKEYEENTPSWQEKCWQMHYEYNEEKRKRWFYFGLRKSLTLEQFKERARAEWERDKDKTTFSGFSKHHWGHPTDADRDPYIFHCSVPDYFRRLIRNSEGDKIYVSASDLENLCTYEYECKLKRVHITSDRLSVL